MKADRLQFSILLAALLLFASTTTAWCYLMPVFEHELMAYTVYGPFGLGDMGGKTYFYLSHHIECRLPGEMVTWLWLGPLLIVTSHVASWVGITCFIRWVQSSRNTRDVVLPKG